MLLLFRWVRGLLADGCVLLKIANLTVAGHFMRGDEILSVGDGDRDTGGEQHRQHGHAH